MNSCCHTQSSAHTIHCGVYLISKLSVYSSLHTRESNLFPSIMAQIHDQFDTILILDFGSQVCLSGLCSKLG